MTKTVLFDFSALHTPTRTQGIGRYLQMLALGLSRLPADAFRGLRAEGLLWVDAAGRSERTAEFDRVLRHDWRSEPTKKDRYEWAYSRRLGLWRAVRELGADWVHLGDPNATPLAMGLSGCKRMVTCHDLIPLQYPERYLGWRDGYRLGRLLIQRRYRGAEHVIAISESTKSLLVNELGVRPERITRVYNGIDLASWEPERGAEVDEGALKRLGLETGKYLLYVGDTDWRKNADGMVQGLGEASRLGTRLTLAFAGKLNEEKQAAIFHAAEQAGVRSQVKVLGYASDPMLRALYRGALAHLFVSRAEGFGYTVVEAMASGCPVITTSRSSLSEVAGEAAMLVDPEDHRAIGEAIHQLANDAERRDSLIAKGRQQAIHFTCEQQARGVLDAMRSAVD